MCVCVCVCVCVGLGEFFLFFFIVVVFGKLYIHNWTFCPSVVFMCETFGRCSRFYLVHLFTCAWTQACPEDTEFYISTWLAY